MASRANSKAAKIREYLAADPDASGQLAAGWHGWNVWNGHLGRATRQ